MIPTLEEYQRTSGLPLDGLYARVATGQMRCQFMTLIDLRQLVILGGITSRHVVSLDFLIDCFGSADSFSVYRGDFAILEERWRSTRVNTLLMCIVAYLYKPIYMDHLDIGLVTVVRSLQADHTILFMILAETYISTSHCHAHNDGYF